MQSSRAFGQYYAMLAIGLAFFAAPGRANFAGVEQARESSD
jgi:hypothetical protein